MFTTRKVFSRLGPSISSYSVKKQSPEQTTQTLVEAYETAKAHVANRLAIVREGGFDNPKAIEEETNRVLAIDENPAKFNTPGMRS